MKLSVIYLTGLVGFWMLVNEQNGYSQKPGQAFAYPNQPQHQAVADSLDAATGLVLAPGFKMVKANCVRCHSPKLITAKRASREGWIATIRWMQQTQGLGDLGAAEPEILDYLTKHYALSKSGRRPALQVTEWYKLEK